MQVDQQIRNEILESGASFEERGKEVIAIDSASTEYLKGVVERYGWPDSMIAGSEASHAAFLLVQHSNDNDFQKHALTLMTEVLDHGGIDLEDYAFLYDRVQVREGKPQKYGSQAYSDSLGVYHFYPIADSINIDARRAEMGMMPFSDYIRLMKQVYQFE